MSPEVAERNAPAPAPPRAKSAAGTFDVVLRLLRAEDSCRTVLDLPCGQGALTTLLLQDGYNVFSGDCVNDIRVTGSEFRQLDMNERLPFEDDELDAILCVDGIEHIERTYDFCKECHRVLRPGGVLIVTTPNISSLRSRWRWLLTGFHHGRKTPLDETRPNPLHHINMLEYHKLRYMLHREGLLVTDIETNRAKAIAYAFAPLIPLCWLMTRFVFWKELKDKGRHLQDIAREVQGQMFTPQILFGGALIVKARKRQPTTG